MLLLLLAAAQGAAPPAPRTLVETAIAFQSIALVVLTALGVWVRWSLGRLMLPRAEHDAHVRAQADAEKEIERRVHLLDRRVETVATQVTARLDQLPTQREFADLRVLLEQNRGVGRELNARLEGTAKTLDQTEKLVGIMHTHLLDEARK